MVVGVAVVSMGERVAGIREGRGRERRTVTGPSIARPQTFPNAILCLPLCPRGALYYCPPFCR